MAEAFTQLLADITPEEVRVKESLQAELDKFIRLSVAVRGNNDNPEDVNMTGFAGYIFSSGTRLEKRALLSCLNQTLYLKDKAVVTEV